MLISGSKYNKDSDESVAFISALIGSSLQRKYEIEVPEEKSFSCLRRIPGQNIIIAASFSDLYVFKLGTRKFSIIERVQNLHMGIEPMCDICIRGNRIYTCSEGDDYVGMVKYNLNLK